MFYEKHRQVPKSAVYILLVDTVFLLRDQIVYLDLYTGEIIKFNNWKGILEPFLEHIFGDHRGCRFPKGCRQKPRNVRNVRASSFREYRKQAK